MGVDLDRVPDSHPCSLNGRWVGRCYHGDDERLAVLALRQQLDDDLVSGSGVRSAFGVRWSAPKLDPTRADRRSS
jgi:hypothetical protein